KALVDSPPRQGRSWARPDPRGHRSGGGDSDTSMAERDRIHLMDERAVRRALARMAREIVEKNDGTAGLVLVGIHRRGVDLAALLQEEVRRAGGTAIATGSLDITLYRDDLAQIGPRP